MWPFDLHLNQIQNCHTTFVIITVLETKCGTTKYYYTHFFHWKIWPHNWPAPIVSAFIAQLVEHRTDIARSWVQTPLKSWIFFSGFFTQLHKLRSLRWSFLHFQNYYKSKLRSNKTTRHVYIVYRLALHF